MRKSGIPAKNIILMMQDDVAGSEENKFPGQLFNRPGNDAVDVYNGCKVDYRGSIVTAKLFLSVITGEESGVPDGGKVLKSGPNDRVFLNFIDHGGVGIVAFPNGPLLHASALSKALQTMQKKDMFKELVFYMEACESGSMFPDLTQNGKILAVTASNAKESSWGYYCPSNDTVKGKHLGTCLGDLFSISWMEDSDLGHMSMESISEQVKRVTHRTNKSHVSTFGDTSFEDEPIGSFELTQAVDMAFPLPGSSAGAVDIRDIPLRLAYNAWEQAETEDQKLKTWEHLKSVVAAREADEQLFQKIADSSCAEIGSGCAYSMIHSKQAMKDLDCHRELTATLHEACPRRANHDAGGWNAFNMKFSQTLVNLCESRARLHKELQDIQGIVRKVCNDASKSTAAAVLVV
jgi:legumain